MRPIRSLASLAPLASLLAGFVLATILFGGMDSAQSGEESAGRAAPVETASGAARAAAQRDLVARVRRALGPKSASHTFQLVVIATEHGIYTESFGILDPIDGAVLATKLHAMGDWAGAEAEVLLGDDDEDCDEDCDEGEDEEEDDDYEDDEDEDDDFADEDPEDDEDEFGENLDSDER